MHNPSMAKKGAKKKSTSKKATKKKTSKKPTRKKSSSKPKVSVEKVQIEMQPILVENFVALQEVMVNLSTKFETLNTKITELLELFEGSAKAMAKKDFNLGGEKEDEILEKLNGLQEQNKLIARGLTLVHEKSEAAEPFPPIQTPAPIPTPRPPQRKEIRTTPPEVPKLKVPGRGAPKKPEEYKRSA